MNDAKDSGDKCTLIVVSDVWGDISQAQEISETDAKMKWNNEEQGLKQSFD